MAHQNTYGNVRNWCKTNQVDVNDHLKTANGTILRVVAIKDAFVRAEVVSSEECHLNNKILNLHIEVLVFFQKN